VARAQDVQPGQVWLDARGAALEVLGPQGRDGKFPTRNAMGKTASKGPRTFVQLSGSNPYPGQAAQGGYPHAGPIENDAPHVDYGPEAYGGWDLQPPRYAEEAPPVRYDRPPPQHGPPPAFRSAPPIHAMRPPPPPPPALRAPGRNGRLSPGYPSELTAHVAQRLAAMPPHLAASPSMVSQEVARALAAWKGRPPARR
jgi:hypothetical protein